MSVRIRNVRFGFGFYLGISALIHLVGFLFISFAPLESERPDPKEVVPAKVEFQQPVRESSLASGMPDYMPMDEGELSTEDDGREIRQATGLPASMRSSPRPHAHGKGQMVRYVQLPDPSALREEFQPPETSELPDNIREIEVSTGSMDPVSRIPTVDTSDTETGEDLMSLGGENIEEDVQRRLIERPSFPYSRARPHLPEHEINVGFDLVISSNGSVDRVDVSESSGRQQLDNILTDWVEKWKYQPGSNTVRQTVVVQIPGS